MIKIIIFILSIMSNLSILTYAQNTQGLQTKTPSTSFAPPNDFEQNHGFNNITAPVNKVPCQEIIDSNAYTVLPSSGLAFIFFYSEREITSLKMKALLGEIKLERAIPFYCVNIDTNKSLMQTYKVLTTPSITIIQNKRVIYTTVGFTDDTKTLSDILNRGIKNNLSISLRNR